MKKLCIDFHNNPGISTVKYEPANTGLNFGRYLVFLMLCWFQCGVAKVCTLPRASQLTFSTVRGLIPSARFVIIFVNMVDQ